MVKVIYVRLHHTHVRIILTFCSQKIFRLNGVNIKQLAVFVNTQCGLVQWLWSVRGREKHVKWAKLLDKVTIAGHSHLTAAELYVEISDHIPLLKEVSNRFGYLL